MSNIIEDRFRQIGNLGVSLRTALAELVGVACFVFIGTAAVLITHSDPAFAGVTNVPVALAFGLGLMVMVYTTAHSSGGHINPAITLALLSSGVTPALQASVTILAQLLGGVLGSAVIYIVFPHHYLKNMHLGANAIPPGVSWHHAFLAETVGTFILALVVMETAFNRRSKANSAAPVAIGLTLTALMIVLSPVSTCSLNPARSFGPALMSFHFRQLWLFILAPCIGALLAVPMHLASVSGLDTVPESRMAEAGVPNVEDPGISSGDSAAQQLLPGNRN